MCIIAVTNKTTDKVSKERFENCWNNNSDGFGMMYVKDGKVVSYKTLDEDKAYAEYERVSNLYHELTPIVLHFRIGTQGGNTIDNCHPFEVSSEMHMCHNGILSEYSTQHYRKTYPGKSDTRLYVDKVLKELPVWFEYNESTIEIIEGSIGTSKFVFLNTNCDAFIVNESLGVRDESGIWYSNGTYKYSYGNFFTGVGCKSKPSMEECPFCGKLKKLSELCTTGICGDCAERYDASTGELIKGTDDVMTFDNGIDTLKVKIENLPNTVLEYIELLLSADWNKDFDNLYSSGKTIGRIPVKGDKFKVLGTIGFYKVLSITNQKYTCERIGYPGTCVFYDKYLKEYVTDIINDEGVVCG